MDQLSNVFADHEYSTVINFIEPKISWTHNRKCTMPLSDSGRVKKLELSLLGQLASMQLH